MTCQCKRRALIQRSCYRFADPTSVSNREHRVLPDQHAGPIGVTRKIQTRAKTRDKQRYKERRKSARLAKDQGQPMQSSARRVKTVALKNRKAADAIFAQLDLTCKFAPTTG